MCERCKLITALATNGEVKALLERYVVLGNKFMEKVETGRAHSRETYLEFKALLAEYKEKL